MALHATPSTIVRSSTPACLALTLALVACGGAPTPASPAAGSNAPASSATSASKGSAPSAAPGPVAGKAVLFAKLPLKGVVAGETGEVEMNPMGIEGGIKTSTFIVSVRKAEDFDKETMADEQANILEHYTGKNIKTETLADGWLIAFDNSSTDGSSKNFWVVSRRKIGGTDYLCEATQSTPEKRAGAAAFCKTLTLK